MSQQAKQLQESQVTLPEHFLVASGDPCVTVMNCPDCDYSSTNKHYLRQHTDLVHTNERPFKCPFCDYAGKRSHSLKEHLIVHSDERPYKCTQCNAKFRKKGHLTNHHRMHSESQSSVVVCSLCASAIFESRDELYDHLRTLHVNQLDVSVFCCNRCNYATTVKGNLHVHEMAHTDYRHVLFMKPKLPPSANIILKCSDCGFETNQRKDLEKHVIERHLDQGFGFVNGQPKVSWKEDNQAVGTNSKPVAPVAHGSAPKYKCTECGFITSDHQQLIGHAFSHKPVLTNERMNSNTAINVKSISQAYVCSICNYFCDTQRTLKAHMWKHSGHKNLHYPTFQNGPLSVYDDTPLAAKHFVDNNANEQHQSTTWHLSEDNANNASVLNNTEASVVIEKFNNDFPLAKRSKLVQKVTQKNSSPRVIVQRLCQAENIGGIIYDRPLNSLEYHITSDEEAQGATTGRMNSDTIHVVEEVVNHLQNSVDDPLKVMTAVCEVAKRHSVDESELSKKAETKVRIDSNCYSATEKTAATLLSLLRQGPNINPACPPAGYTYEVVNATTPAQPGLKVGTGSSVLGDVACEEVVEFEMADTGSSDSGQASDIHSLEKPKTGICSSLLAVIEQLRERQAEDNVHLTVGKGRRKRRNDDLDDQISDDFVVVPGEGEGQDIYASSVPGVMYRCKPCHYRTSSSKKMQEHIILHKDTSDVDVSPSEFDGVDSSDAAADGVVYRCKLCHYRSAVHLMKQHMKMHKNKKPHECSLCDFVATDTANLQDHMIQHCKARQYQCKQCSAVFNYKSQLRAHTRVHEDGQAFYCEHCEYVTSYIDSFQDHLKVHSEVFTSFTCIACRQAFSDLKELQTHMKELCEEVKKLHRVNPLLDSKTPTCQKPSDQVTRTLKCDQCEFVALSVRSLKSHLKRHVNDKRYIQQPLEQYKCNMCGYVCHHMPSLKSHMWRHANETDFSYSFSDLLNESTTPLDKEGKPLITLRCCQCGFETLEKRELDKHMKSHWDIIKKTFDVGTQAKCE